MNRQTACDREQLSTGIGGNRIFHPANKIGHAIVTLLLVITTNWFANPGWASDKLSDRELRIVVNYAAGGAVDRTARSMQKFLPDVLGQSVLVENHKGAGGKIGLQKFMSSDPDGYTVLTAFAPGTTLVKHKDPDVFQLQDLAIINVQWSDPVILVARRETGWKSLSDMIEDVRANPDKFSFGSSGKGAAGPLLSEILFTELDLQIKTVPYQGGGKTRAAFKGGHVDMTAAGAGGALSIQEDAVVLGAFWNAPVTGWPNAKPMNEQLESYGVTVPAGGSYRFHAVHRSVRDDHPQRWNTLVNAFREVTTNNAGFDAFAQETGVGADWLGPDKSEELIRKIDQQFTRILQEEQR